MDIKLVIKIQILEMPINSMSPRKATSDTKIDMVNPTPAIKETKKIDVQFKSLGFLANPRKLKIEVNNIIPSGLPISNPKYIPRNTVGNFAILKLEFMLIPVFEKANIGIIKRLLTGRIYLSNLCKVEVEFLYVFKGMAIARSIPLNVE